MVRRFFRGHPRAPKRGRWHALWRLGNGFDSGRTAACHIDFGGTQHQYADDGTHTDRQESRTYCQDGNEAADALQRHHKNHNNGQRQ